jgi:hypothetical protein
VRRAESWNIADILDFEYLLAADASGEDATTRARDRAIFETDIAAELDDTTRGDRRFIFRRWLDARRKVDGDTLPGGHFTTGWQTLLTLAALVGLGLGVSLTAGLLHYRGDEPVNIAWFLAATVGVQWLLLAVGLVCWLLRRTTRLLDDFRPLRALLAALLWMLSAGLRQLPGEQRERFRAVLATISHRREIYGSLATWPLLVVTQLFGVCFNLGVLATLLLQITLSDVAFGWSSTLRASPEEVFHLVSAIATPWNFAPNPHPTLAQAYASQFTYSAGIQPLSQSAMTSWWPFLCYTVVVYGLLVRGLLLVWSTVRLRGALRAIAFDHQGCNALLRRLTGPVFRAQGEVASLNVPAPSETAPTHATGGCVVLRAEELSIDDALLADSLRAHYGWQLLKTLLAQIDHPSGNAEVLAEVAATAPRLASIVVAVPARRAPIKAIALFLQKVAGASGGVETLVLLFGPRDGGSFAPVTDEDFAHWRSFNAIHGLHLGLEKWRPA